MFNLKIFTVFLMLGSVLSAGKLPVIDVFYKDKEPSQRALKKIKEVLQDFDNAYQIRYFLIDAEETNAKIEEYGLPSTHFPVAVVIDGKFTAEIDGKTIYFVHFPLFMKGIGRHEANWSLNDLKKVLVDPSLLTDENILPVLDEAAETSECEE